MKRYTGYQIEIDFLTYPEGANKEFVLYEDVKELEDALKLVESSCYEILPDDVYDTIKGALGHEDR